MTYHDEEEDSYDAPGADDPELPDASDMDDPADDSAETVPCPHCGSEVYEAAERCPRCGRYLSDEDAPLRRPRWLVAGVVVCIVVIVITWVLSRP